MTELVSSNGNYCNYRKTFADCVNFKIPILGVHLKDLIAVHVVFPDWINEDKVNLVKMQQLSVTLSELVALQTASHHLEPNMDLINLLTVRLICLVRCNLRIVQKFLLIYSGATHNILVVWIHNTIQYYKPGLIFVYFLAKFNNR